MPIEISHSVKTDIGLKRTTNEDCFLAEPALGLYVVCDGMGGSNAGEIASAMAVNTIRRTLATSLFSDGSSSSSGQQCSVPCEYDRLAAAIRSANQAIHHESWSQAGLTGMGTTVVAAYIVGERLFFAHVGDSRLYLFREGSLQVLTQDHSWVAEQVRNGGMTEREAECSPKRHIITRALGIESAVEVDIGDIVLLSGDRLLCCSDGLTRGVRSEEIGDVLGHCLNIAYAADCLVAMANQAGGDDNTTVLIVSVESMRLWQRIRQDWLLPNA
ncbi:protein-serine/threonine phosphatase [Nitrospira sp. KM1]|uniref:Stp1/IreP family PP2C-type Ser/Thr phosphatase n=1 Tax=Nitrospira sp. KM1 TaxID=1936990 RepID=UPI0013A72302|nr:Stp1/IreP family PP2C-type Ser/Thr phosphatase [Nitrospira sp. KM1]BCA57014.1 protein-serine/threonine phosphatase [Nitrospira sp. KM1]